jgi:hypothetical protein
MRCLQGATKITGVEVFYRRIPALAFLPPLAYDSEALSILVRVNRIVSFVTSDRPIHQRQYSHHSHNRPRPRDRAWAVGRPDRRYT